MSNPCGMPEVCLYPHCKCMERLMKDTPKSKKRPRRPPDQFVTTIINRLTSTATGMLISTAVPIEVFKLYQMIVPEEIIDTMYGASLLMPEYKYSRNINLYYNESRLDFTIIYKDNTIPWLFPEKMNPILETTELGQI